MDRSHEVGLGPVFDAGKVLLFFDHRVPAPSVSARENHRKIPLSTTGAVFIAQAGPKTDKTKLFRDMIIWGLSMSVVGAVVSWLFFTVLRVP